MLVPLILAACASAAPQRSVPGVSLGTPLTPAARGASVVVPTAALPSLPALPALSLPAAALPSAALPASAASKSERPAAAAQPRSAEAEASEGMRRFDNAPGKGDAAPVDGAAVSGWSRESFESADGLRVAFERRDGGRGSARVYGGGLALQESFEPLLRSARKPTGPEYVLWTRGHPPTGWKPTKSVIDADARDLARMIAIAGRASPTGKVELALHSFGTLVFQRMLQLREEPEVREALRRLAGSRVVLLHATTHYEGSERKAGPEFEQMGAAAKAFVAWLDAGDAVVDQWQAAARLNPMLLPTASMLASQWDAQRNQALALASNGAGQMMKKDLEAKWDPAYDSIRKELVAALKKDARDPAWQESLMRRSSDMFRLDVTPRDAAFLRRLGVRVELVHGDGDALLNWASAQALFELLGIPTPAKTPPAGTVLTDRTGRIRARIVAGDHYWPLKRRDELGALLDE